MYTVRVLCCCGLLKVNVTHHLEDHHDDVIKWKHFPRYWPFVWGIHRSPVNSPHKGQWRGALMFTLICAWINGWVNNLEAGDLRPYHAHFDVIAMHHCIRVIIILHECQWSNPEWYGWMDHNTHNIEGLVQDRSIFIVNALEILQSCTNLSI